MTGVQQISAIIHALPRGTIFFPEDFSVGETRHTVSKALSRLCSTNVIMRLCQGVYCFPKIDSKYGLGVLHPSIEEVAYAIAKRDKARIVPTGSYALNKLGLSTQLQANVVFYTDGSARRVKIGNGRGVLFMTTTEPKRFLYQNKLMQLIVAALREIGLGKVTDAELEIIKNHLAGVPEEEYKHDASLAPAWVQDILKKIR
jgi:hypothetical protein